MNMEKAKIQINHLIQQFENERQRFSDFYNSSKFIENTTGDKEVVITYTNNIYNELIGELSSVLQLIDSHKEWSGTLNETRRKRDEVKNKLAVALKEIKMRKKYESFLKSCIRSGEPLSDDHNFEWFCEKYEFDRSMF